MRPNLEIPVLFDLIVVKFQSGNKQRTLKVKVSEMEIILTGSKINGSLVLDPAGILKFFPVAEVEEVDISKGYSLPNKSALKLLNFLLDMKN